MPGSTLRFKQGRGGWAVASARRRAFLSDPLPLRMDRPLVPSDEIEAVARRFKLLGAPVRLELLNALREGGEQTVGELVEATGYRQANVSKHLGTMAENGLLARRRDGVHVYYALDDPTLPALCMLVSRRLREEAGEDEGSPEQ